jgi:hypothetical protein
MLLTLLDCVVTVFVLFILLCFHAFHVCIPLGGDGFDQGLVLAKAHKQVSCNIDELLKVAMITLVVLYGGGRKEKRGMR